MKYTKLPNNFIKYFSFFQNVNKLLIEFNIFQQVINILKVEDIGVLNILSARKIKDILN